MDGILNDDGMDLPFMPPPQQAQPQAPQAQPQGMFGKFNQAITNNSDVLMAAAIGMAPNTPIGGALAGVQEHYRLQDQLKQKKDAQAAMMALKREQMENQKSIATDKLDLLKTKALQGGAPKVIGRVGGRTTLLWPDKSVTSVLDAEAQEMHNTLEANKDNRAALIAGTKLQGDVLSPKAQEAEAAQTTAISEAQKSYAQFKDLRALMDDTGGISLISRLAPNGISETVNRIFGTKDGEIQAGIAKLNMQSFIKLVSGFPGALSNKEGDRIASALPKVDDDPKLWAKFFRDWGPMLENDYQNMVKQQEQSQAQKAATLALPSYRNGGGGGPAKPMQKYPPGFNPPNSGMGQNPEDRTAILQAELQAEQAKPASPERERNIQSLQRELGMKPQAQPMPVASAGPARFNTPADVRAAVAAGKLKSGDSFVDANGITRKVK